MVRASPFVIKNISQVLKKRDFAAARDLLKKFSERYSEDTELLKICEQYSEYLKTPELDKIEDIKKSLKRLKNIRMNGAVQVKGLWFRDRRVSTMQIIQVT